MAVTCPNLAWNNTETRLSQPIRARGTPDFPYPLIIVYIILIVIVISFFLVHNSSIIAEH